MNKKKRNETYSYILKFYVHSYGMCFIFTYIKHNIGSPFISTKISIVIQKKNKGFNIDSESFYI